MQTQQQQQQQKTAVSVRAYQNAITQWSVQSKHKHKKFVSSMKHEGRRKHNYKAQEIH